MPDVPGLSGRWLGRYDYDGMAMEPVSFEAELTEVPGSLGGRIFEPNTFRDDRGAALEARIEGRWSFAGLPGVSGRFVMMRKPRAAIAREQLAVEGIEI